MTSATGSPPLTGVRVLDLTRLLPGPYATQILCDLGAEVIKIEDTAGGDYVRYYPPLANDGNSVSFHALNRGKKSVQLDLKDAEAREQLWHLMRSSHVLIESFRPGVLGRLGFDTQTIEQRCPHMIVCSISGYGQTGPDCMQAGHDANYLARAGVLGMMREPAILPVQVADLCGGAYPAVVQILAALRQQERTGRGAFIDVSMTDCSYALLAMSQAIILNKSNQVDDGSDGGVGGGGYILCGRYPCYDVYRTADGHITVGSLEPKFWLALMNALERPDLVPQQMDESGRVREELTRIFAARSNAEWTRVLADVDCCCEVVKSPDTILTDNAQLASRELTVPVSIEGVTYTLPKTPLRMSGVHMANTRGPGLGEHNASLLPAKL